MGAPCPFSKTLYRGKSVWASAFNRKLTTAAEGWNKHQLVSSSSLWSGYRWCHTLDFENGSGFPFFCLNPTCMVIVWWLNLAASDTSNYKRCYVCLARSRSLDQTLTESEHGFSRFCQDHFHVRQQLTTNLKSSSRHLDSNWWCQRRRKENYVSIPFI